MVEVPVAVVVQVPLYVTVTCSVLVLLEVCRIMDFLGDDRLEYVSVFCTSAWFDSGYFLRQSVFVFSAVLGSSVYGAWHVQGLVLLVTLHLALCSFLVGRPRMLDFMAVLDQKDSCNMVPMFRLLKLWSLRSCSPSRMSTSLSRCRGSLSWSRLFVGL